MDIPELPSVDAPPASADAPRGGGDTAETPQRRTDAQHDQARVNADAWVISAVATGRASGVVVVGGVGVAAVEASVDVGAHSLDGCQLSGASRPVRSTTRA